MRSNVRPLGIAAATAAILALSTPARADQIDGEWCHASQSLMIEGPKIRTPGGNQIQGDYSRHGFRYTVPASEPDAGSDIVMRQQSDEQMTLMRKDKPDEIWRRCKVTS